MNKNIVIADSQTLVISKACVEDAQEIISFLNCVGGETDFLTFGLNKFHVSLVDEIATIFDCLERNVCLMLVGKIENDIVAQLFLQRSDNLRLAHIGEIGVSVCRQHWGKSIGRLMMEAAIEWSRNSGVGKLQLQVRVDNQRAVQLYNKLGFVIEGTITRALKINELYFDEYLMGLLL